MMERRFTLTGLARFSPRLRLLTRLAQSDDPILSAGALSLIRDVGASRLGMAYELITAFAYPMLQICRVSLIVLSITRPPALSLSAPFASTLRSLEILLIGIRLTEIVLILGALLLGGLVAVWPGVALVSREHGGHGLRFHDLQPGLVFKSLLKLQAVSVMIPVLVFMAASAAYRAALIIYFMWGGHWLTVVSDTIIALVIITALTLAAVSASLNFPRLFPSLACSAAVALLWFSAQFLLEFISVSSRRPLWPWFEWATGLAFLAAMIWWARRSVYLRVMPAK